MMNGQIVEASKIVGLVVRAVVGDDCLGQGLCISFTDGRFIRFIASGYGGDGYVEVSDEDPSDIALVEIGLLSREEYERRQKEFAAKTAEAERLRRLAMYERLKSEFE